MEGRGKALVFNKTVKDRKAQVLRLDRLVFRKHAEFEVAAGIREAGAL